MLRVSQNKIASYGSKNTEEKSTYERDSQTFIQNGSEEKCETEVRRFGMESRECKRL